MIVLAFICDLFTAHPNFTQSYTPPADPLLKVCSLGRLIYFCIRMCDDVQLLWVCVVQQSWFVSHHISVHELARAPRWNGMKKIFQSILDGEIAIATPHPPSPSILITVDQ